MKQYKYVCECGQEYESDFGFNTLWCLECGRIIPREDTQAVKAPA